MNIFKLKIADIPVEAEVRYNSTVEFCREYFTDEEPRLRVIVDSGHIDTIREETRICDIFDGRVPGEHTDEELEPNALLLALMDNLLDYGVLLFHGVAVAAGGRAYIFTAGSGVGKTTHTQMLVRRYPNCHILNGDKPLILFRDNRVFVCGSPWQGKENYGVNEILPLEAVCILERDKKNHIERISFSEAFEKLFFQTHRPVSNRRLCVYMKYIQRLTEIKMYRLRCNMDEEAVEVSYGGMMVE